MAAQDAPDYLTCTGGRQCVPRATDDRSIAINNELRCCHDQILAASETFPWLSELIPANGIYTSSDQVRDVLAFCRSQIPPICHELSLITDRTYGIRGCSLARQDVFECCSSNFNNDNLTNHNLSILFTGRDMRYRRYWTAGEFVGACAHYNELYGAIVGTCLPQLNNYRDLCLEGREIRVPFGLLNRPTTLEDLYGIDPLRDSHLRGMTLAEIISYAVNNFVFPIAGIILFVMILWGGVDVVLGSAKGEANRIEQGKKRITAAVIGFVILFSAFWIIQVVELVFFYIPDDPNSLPITR